MKIETTAGDLRSRLTLHAQAKVTSYALPVLTGVRISVLEARSVEYVTSNLDITVVTHQDGGVIDPTGGPIVVPFAQLKQIVSGGSAKDDVTIIFEGPEGEHDPGKVTVTRAGLVSTINLLPLGEFPPVTTSLDGYRLAASVRPELAAFMVSAACTDDARLILTGVLLDTEKEEIVSTDSYRLIVGHFEKEHDGFEGVGWNETPRALIPAKAFTAVLKAGGKNPGRIYIWQSTGESPHREPVALECTSNGRAVIFSRIIEGEFPNYEQLVRTNDGFAETVIPVNAETLANFCTQVSKRYGRGEPAPVRILPDGKAEVRQHNGDMQAPAGTVEAVPDHRFPGEAVAFNPQFLAAMLQGPNIIPEIRVIDPLKPAVVQGIGWQGLLMPVRVS